VVDRVAHGVPTTNNSPDHQPLRPRRPVCIDELGYTGTVSSTPEPAIGSTDLRAISRYDSLQAATVPG
jgi:hypothetical protein